MTGFEIQSRFSRKFSIAEKNVYFLHCDDVTAVFLDRTKKKDTYPNEHIFFCHLAKFLCKMPQSITPWL